MQWSTGGFASPPRRACREFVRVWWQHHNSHQHRRLATTSAAASCSCSCSERGSSVGYLFTSGILPLYRSLLNLNKQGVLSSSLLFSSLPSLTSPFLSPLPSQDLSELHVNVNNRTCLTTFPLLLVTSGQWWGCLYRDIRENYTTGSTLSSLHFLLSNSRSPRNLLQANHIPTLFCEVLLTALYGSSLRQLQRLPFTSPFSPPLSARSIANMKARLKTCLGCTGPPVWSVQRYPWPQFPLLSCMCFLRYSRRVLEWTGEVSDGESAR